MISNPYDVASGRRCQEETLGSNSLTFSQGPQNSSHTKVLSCMDNTRRTSRGDEGFGGTKLSFIAQALRAGEVGEAGHLIPTLGSVMGKWNGIGSGWGRGYQV